MYVCVGVSGEKSEAVDQTFLFLCYFSTLSACSTVVGSNISLKLLSRQLSENAGDIFANWALRLTKKKTIPI